MRSSYYDYTMIMVCVAFGIQVAVIVLIEDKDTYGNKDVLVLTIL